MYSSIIIENGKIPIEIRTRLPYFDFPSSFLFEAIAGVITGLNIMLLQKFFNILIVFLIIIVLYNTLHFINILKKENIMILPLSIYLTLSSTSIIYLPQYFGLILFILEIYFLLHILYSMRNVTVKLSFALTLLSLAVASAHHLTALVLFVTCSLVAFSLIGIHNKKKNSSVKNVFLIPIIVVLFWFMYNATYSIITGHSIIDSLNKVFLHKEELSFLLVSVYVSMDPLQIAFSSLHRMFIIGFLSFSGIDLLRKVFLKKDFNSYNLLLMSLGSAIVNVPLFFYGIAPERILVFTNIFLAISFSETLASIEIGHKKLKNKVLLSMLTCLLILSYVIPNYYGELTELYPQIYEVKFAGYLAQNVPVEGKFFSDLYLCEIFYFKLTTLRNYFSSRLLVFHDRFAYSHEYLVNVLLQRNILIGLTERTIKRWYNLYHESLPLVIASKKINLIYNSGKAEGILLL
jgi:hypothetical protein